MVRRDSTVDTYCRTLILAAQLGRPIIYIPQNKISELLDYEHPDKGRVAGDESKRLVEAIADQVVSLMENRR